MTVRYFSNLTLALVAGFIVVATQAFATGRGWRSRPGSCS